MYRLPSVGYLRKNIGLLVEDSRRLTSVVCNSTFVDLEKKITLLPACMLKGCFFISRSVLNLCTARHTVARIVTGRTCSGLYQGKSCLQVT